GIRTASRYTRYPSSRLGDSSKPEFRALGVALGRADWHTGCLDRYKNQLGLATRMAAEPSHLEGVDYELTPHIFSERPADHLAVEQVQDRGQKQPSLVGRDVSNVAGPYLVGLGHGEVAIQQLRHNRQAMSAVRGRDPETALAAGANALSPQLSPDPRPAVGSAIRRIHGADMHQQSLITQMATRNHTPPANPVFMVTGHAHPQNSALHTDRPHPPVTLNKGVLHFWPFAKYAVAFPRMSRSILTRDNSARKRLISICSTLTALLLAGPFSRPSRFALTQLYKVCSTTPRLRAAAAMLWPDSTIRTASCLNSSVYCARVAFVISVSLLY